jgi:uncharacterized membrane protein
MMSECERRPDSTESNTFNDNFRLALFEIVVDIILLCGLVATAQSPLLP